MSPGLNEYIYIYIYIYIHTYKHMYVCVCMYIYIYIHIYPHTHLLRNRIQPFDGYAICCMCTYMLRIQTWTTICLVDIDRKVTSLLKSKVVLVWGIYADIGCGYLPNSVFSLHNLINCWHWCLSLNQIAECIRHNCCENTNPPVTKRQ